MREQDAQLISPIEWAFVGDSVYSLYFRTLVVEKCEWTSNAHLVTDDYVNAKAQSDCFDAIMLSGAFTPEEQELARRAKNVHIHMRTHASTALEYRKATALEAVIGYKHLVGDCKRVMEILALCAEHFGLEPIDNQSN